MFEDQYGDLAAAQRTYVFSGKSSFVADQADANTQRRAQARHGRADLRMIDLARNGPDARPIRVAQHGKPMFVPGADRGVADSVPWTECSRRGRALTSKGQTAKLWLGRRIRTRGRGEKHRRSCVHCWSRRVAARGGLRRRCARSRGSQLRVQSWSSAKPAGFGQVRARLAIGWRHHGVVLREAPLRAIFLRGQSP